MFNAVIDAPFGKIGIRVEGDSVHEIVYLPDSVRNVAPDTPLAQETVQQIEHYHERASSTFDLPLADIGTAFQRRVWRAAQRHSAGHRADLRTAREEDRHRPARGRPGVRLELLSHRDSNAIAWLRRAVSAGSRITPTTATTAQSKRWLLAHEGVHYV